MRGRYVDPFVGFRVSPPGSNATAWKCEGVRPVFIYDSQFQVATDRCHRGRSPLKIAVSGCARSIYGRPRDGHTRKGAPPLWLARQVLRARGRRANTNIRQCALRSCSKLTTFKPARCKFFGNSAKLVSPCPPADIPPDDKLVGHYKIGQQVRPFACRQSVLVIRVYIPANNFAVSFSGGEFGP
jgi:hypothetical protein